MIKHAKHSVCLLFFAFCLRLFCVCFAFALRLFCVLFASQAKGARKAPPKTAPKSETQSRDAKKKKKNSSLGTPALWL